MRFLAGYTMRGRMQAILVVTVAALLSLLLPPLSYLSGGALGLVALRVGGRQALSVAVFAAAAVGALGLLLPGLQTPWLGPAFLVTLWLPVVAVAFGLRRSADLGRALLSAGALGVGLIIGVYLFGDDPSAWWAEVIREFLARASEAGAVTSESMDAAVTQLAGLMTGVAAAIFVVSLLGCLLVARWWQALLYNPGGFQREFHDLRLGRHASGAGLLLLALAALPLGTFQEIAAQAVLVAAALFLFQGLAVLHGLVGRRGGHVGWLIGVYVLLFLAPPQTAVMLALGGAVDNWFGFREFFGGKGDRTE